jgi:hypothetical protein
MLKEYGSAPKIGADFTEHRWQQEKEKVKKETERCRFWNVAAAVAGIFMGTIATGPTICAWVRQWARRGAQDWEMIDTNPGRLYL